MSNKATECADDDVDVVVPKMKAIAKPKNLKKRKRDLNDQGEDEDPNKKPKSEEHTEEEVSGVSKLEEMKLLQQMRASRPKGSDMSSEHVQLSKAAIGSAEDQSIGSLTQNFTGQRAQVNTLDTRMEEFIEREMAKRKAARAESGTEDSVEAGQSRVEPVVEEESDSEEEEQSLKAPSSLPEESLPQIKGDTGGGPVIDLSNTILRATSSTQSSTTSTEPTKKWHRNDAPTTTTGILEVDLPVEEQLRMFEATRQAALDALRDQRKRKPKRPTDELSGFDDFAETTTGNMSSDFSKHKRYEATVGNKATDEQVYDRYKKKQASSFR